MNYLQFNMFRTEFAGFFSLKINERNAHSNVFIDSASFKKIYIKGCENVADCKRPCNGHCLNNDPCNSTNGFCTGGCAPGYLGTFCNQSMRTYHYFFFTQNKLSQLKKNY